MPFRSVTHWVSFVVPISFDECSRRLRLFDEGYYDASQQFVCRFASPHFCITERRLFYAYLASTLRGTISTDKDHCVVKGSFHPGISVQTMLHVVFTLMLTIALVVFLVWFPLSRDIWFLLLVIFLIFLGVTRIIILLMRDERNNRAVYETMVAELECMLMR
jgi:hypothetical protein